MCGISLTRTVLFYVGSFPYTPIAVLCTEFLLQALCCFMWGVLVTHPVLFYLGSFSSTPSAVLCVWCVCVAGGGGLSYTPYAILCGEFL